MKLLDYSKLLVWTRTLISKEIMQYTTCKKELKFTKIQSTQLKWNVYEQFVLSVT